MIGNDIVDLVLAQKESHWQRKGFLDKIFTQDEQLLILNSTKPELMVWNLWSRKEAAYKIYNRNTQIRGYIPLQFECFDLELNDAVNYGKVVIQDFVYYTKTVVSDEHINTIAVENKDYLERIKFLKNRKNIRKINGIPAYFEVNEWSSTPVSISHHGRFEQIITI
ncbi:4'-phosphopantetheinyl transferase family protein [Flavobacterium nackdongense]|uniref:4-phosphopantetheinyl transferase family protein n=1 Tax=Flavobacterium nackdongense TaxID=2547394 RepID=A0A4P6YA84_9FLAO|nr:4'-phosphopantetheinyl transferase superfamily protein [Flavobacterium nackdongense]QBN17634.1 4-phosphopantetheinyl transferase family protein [Flavobacterium nackdongense]